VNPVDLLHDASLPGEHVADQVAVALQMSLVGLDTTAATMIPFHIAAKLAGAVVDRADVVFNMRYWQTVPDLNLTGSCVPQPGQPFGFGLVRMPANAAFDVFVNDSQVSTGVTDGTGNYTGSFIFPALPTTETHFVKARTQATGTMAFSVTCTSP
jgi:hypothetical protein